MRSILVKVHPSKANLKKEDQLAWKIAEIASDKSRPGGDSIEMVINRIIDNASVAIASFNRKPVVSARQMALAHPRKNGSTIFGLSPKIKIHCEPVERLGDIPWFISDTSKVQQATKWKPKRDVNSILLEIHDWIIQNEELLRTIIT